MHEPLGHPPAPPDGSDSTWLVTGGTGVIGPSIVDEIVATGATVRVLTRGNHPPADDRRTADGGCVEVVTGDVRDPVVMRSTTAGVDYVVHAAGLAHRRPRSARQAEELFETNLAGACAVAEAARAAGVRRVVFISSASVYGPGDGTRRDERSRPAPATAYARSKLASESAMSAVLDSALTVLRVCAVYGPRVNGQYRLLARAVRSRVPVPVLAGDGHCLVTEHDLAGVARRVALDAGSAGAVYNVSDGVEYTVREIVEAMSTALQVPARRTPVLPRWVGTSIAGGLRAVGGAEWTRRGRLHHSVVSLLDGPRLDSDALRRALEDAAFDCGASAWRRAVDGEPRQDAG